MCKISRRTHTAIFPILKETAEGLRHMAAGLMNLPLKSEDLQEYRAIRAELNLIAAFSLLSRFRQMDTKDQRKPLHVPQK